MDYTKIRFAGEDCILVTDSKKWREPIFILNEADIDRINKEWESK